MKGIHFLCSFLAGHEIFNSPSVSTRQVVFDDETTPVDTPLLETDVGQPSEPHDEGELRNPLRSKLFASLESSASVSLMDSVRTNHLSAPSSTFGDDVPFLLTADPSRVHG